MDKQDFIDKLTDPVEFGFRTLIVRFEKEYGHMLTEVIYWRKDSELLHVGDFSEWHVELIADNKGAVLVLRETLAEYVLDQFPNAKINVQNLTRYDEKTELHSRTYAIAI